MSLDVQIEFPVFAGDALVMCAHVVDVHRSQLPHCRRSYSCRHLVAREEGFKVGDADHDASACTAAADDARARQPLVGDHGADGGGGGNGQPLGGLRDSHS